MLLVEWTQTLLEEEKSNPNKARPRIIVAGVGNPRFPLNIHAAHSGKAYYQKAYNDSKAARSLLGNTHRDAAEIRSSVAKKASAIGYGHPRGDLEARIKFALGLNLWYGKKLNFCPDNILFTVGAAAALHNIFSVLNKLHPHGLILTPFPRHLIYQGPDKSNNLFPIPVMQAQGYRLTAELLASALSAATQEAKKQNTAVSALVLCDPYNPIGSALNIDELKRIAEVLRKYPNLYIILDEAYAEMRFDGLFRMSLLKIAPDLKHRIILIRTATKMLSAAGERMAVTAAFDEKLMVQLTNANIDLYGHSPRSSQHVFADAMCNLGDSELKRLINFYQPQVRLVEKRLAEMGARMPDEKYQVNSTFYVMADFGDLIGLPIPENKIPAMANVKTIRTDEEIVYYLLFNDGVMLQPLSYYGEGDKSGYLRISCCGGDKELNELLDRLEKRLIQARKYKQELLLNLLQEKISKINRISPQKAAEIHRQVQNALKSMRGTALGYKGCNQSLSVILSDSRIFLGRHNSGEYLNYVIKTQARYRGHLGRRAVKEVQRIAFDKWKSFLAAQFAPGELRNKLLRLPPSQRHQFSLWKQALKNGPGATPVQPEFRQVPCKL